MDDDETLQDAETLVAKSLDWAIDEYNKAAMRIGARHDAQYLARLRSKAHEHDELLHRCLVDHKLYQKAHDPEKWAARRRLATIHLGSPKDPSQ